MTYLTTAAFVTYLIPFAILYWRNPRAVGQNLSDTSTWFERLGFYLPPMYPIAPTHGSNFCERTSDAHARPQPHPHPSKRPSSIDGRRPRSNLPMRIEVHGSPVAAPSRGRILHSARSSDEARLLLDHDAESGYGSESDADVSTISAASTVAVLASELPPLSVVETAQLAVQFAIVWFAANYSFVAALEYTSVASGTTLGSTSGFFTLLLGSIMGIEVFTPGKLVSVALSFVGVMLVTWSDGGRLHAVVAHHAVLGDFLAIFSALCYAIYVTLLKVRIGSEDRISMPLFLGLVGAFNLVAFWPLGLLLHATGIEPFALPQGEFVWAGIFLNMAVAVVSDFAYLIAMLKSSPLFTTVGLSLTIPMAALGDLTRYQQSMGIQSALGVILVLLSFGVIAVEENRTA
ncbi:hypothetical protein MVES1_001929 [Malassezia vespertilionis]|nr:uncharacterized protein MVES1_001929 [Malassezia vespertilionis]WFD06577.1 hypothetical protein MVES1_001929 [Malassezia vespertilionis]